MRRPLLGFACRAQAAAEAAREKLGACAAAWHLDPPDRFRDGTFCVLSDGRIADGDPDRGLYVGLPYDRDRLRDVADRCAGGPVSLSSGEIPFGSYAFARCDGDALVLGTDMYGTIPVYILGQDGVCWFSSDVRLLKDLVGPLSVRPLALNELLYRQYPQAPKSGFRDVALLAGAQCAVFDLNAGEMTVFPYHRFSSRVDPDFYAASAAKSVEALEAELEQRLDACVARAMTPHGSAGLFLSGGVDSSALAALARRYTEVFGVHVRLPGPADELGHAQAVARHLDIELRTLDLTPGAFRENFVRTVHEHAFPIFIPNTVGLYAASAQGLFDGADVMLDGELADSHFYASGVTPFILRKYHFRTNLHIGAALYDRFVSRLARFSWALGLTLAGRQRIGGLDQKLFGGMVQEHHFIAEMHGAFAHIADPLERVLAAQTIHLQQSGSRHILYRVDTAAKVADLHALLPFADPEYMNFILNLPARFKIRGKGFLGLRPEPKWLLKRVAAKLVPESAVYRPKAGFDLPILEYLPAVPPGLRGEAAVPELFEMTEEGFGHLADSCAGSVDAHFLTGLEVWARLFVRGESVERVEALFLH